MGKRENADNGSATVSKKTRLDAEQAINSERGETTTNKTSAGREINTIPDSPKDQPTAEVMPAAERPPPEEKVKKTEVAKKGMSKGPSGAVTKTLTVQTIIPSLVKHFIDEDQVKQYPDNVRSRIVALSNYANKQANVYSICKIPSTATWGKYHPLNDHSKVLCNPVTNEPLIFWIVGHIVTMWFEKEGVPDKQASVNIAPLANSVRIQTLKLLAGFSVPQEASVDTYGTSLRATKWQTTKGERDPILFPNVYDARQVLKSKNEMENLSPLDLKKNDLVLLEVKLTHYRLKNAQTDKWGQRAQLEMHAISLIHRLAQEDVDEEKVDNDIKDLWI